MAPLWGVDLLAGNKYQSVIKTVKPKVFGIFTEVNGFGNSLKFTKECIAAGWPELIRHQLVWDDDHVFGRDAFELAKKRAADLQQIAAAYPNFLLFASPYCEHKRSDKTQLEKEFEEISRIAPSVILVNSPIKGGVVLPQYVNEAHHYNYPDMSKCPNVFWSGDGMTKSRSGREVNGTVDVDITADKKLWNRAIAAFGWVLQFNRNYDPDKKIPREKRTTSPTAELVESVLFPLETTKHTATLSDKYTWKSHAEQTMATTALDNRANRPMAIIPQKTDFISLRAGNKEIGRLKFKDAFTGGGYRYYITDKSLYGYVLAKKAKQLTGKPLVSLFVNGRSIGSVNPAFRCGKQR